MFAHISGGLMVMGMNSWANKLTWTILGTTGSLVGRTSTKARQWLDCSVTFSTSTHKTPKISVCNSSSSLTPVEVSRPPGTPTSSNSTLLLTKEERLWWDVWQVTNGRVRLKFLCERWKMAACWQSLESLQLQRSPAKESRQISSNDLSSHLWPPLLKQHKQPGQKKATKLT